MDGALGRDLVGANRFPGISIGRLPLAQYPRADCDVHTRVEQMLLRDAVLGQFRKPQAIDLHDADIPRSILVLAHGIGFEVGFGLGDCAKEIRIDVVAVTDLGPTGIRRKDAPQAKEEEGRSESGFPGREVHCKTNTM